MKITKIILYIIGFLFLVACQEPAPKTRYVQDYLIRVGEFVGENFSTITDSLFVKVYFKGVKEKEYKIKNNLLINPQDIYNINSYSVCNDTILMFLNYNAIPNPVEETLDSVVYCKMSTWEENNHIFIIGNISTNEIYHCYDEKTVLDVKTRILWDTTPEKECQSRLYNYWIENVPHELYNETEPREIKSLYKAEKEYCKFIKKSNITPDTGKLKLNLQTCESLDEVIRERTFKCILWQSERYREIMGK